MKTRENDISLTYRRLGWIDTARTFYDRLSAMGYRVSFASETMRNGMFKEYLYRRIDVRKYVIVVTMARGISTVFGFQDESK